MAQYYDDKSQFRAAREYYKVLLEKYPRTSFAERARNRMQEIRNEPDEAAQSLQMADGPLRQGKIACEA